MSDPLRAFLLFVVLLACLAQACRHTVPLQQAEGSGRGYVWVRLESGDYGLAAADDDALRRGLVDICQGKPCAIEHVKTLDLFRVTVP